MAPAICEPEQRPQWNLRETGVTVTAMLLTVVFFPSTQTDEFAYKFVGL